jgi:ketosteroid isomerase-like protein
MQPFPKKDETMGGIAPDFDKKKPILEYFRRIDEGAFAAELFTEDFQFYFPKFGIGRGPAAFLEMAGGLVGSLQRIAHLADRFQFTEADHMVAVEGMTEGAGADGVDWRGGSTPGGRFCSVFVFDDGGLIERMHIYLDPDYTGADKGRFLWPAEGRVW